MKLPHAVHVILGAAITSTAFGLSPPEVSLEVSATPSFDNTCSDWNTWLPPRTDPAIIMQVVTQGYLPVQKNFIALIEANTSFSRDNIFLICLDSASEGAIALMGFRCVPLVNAWNNDLDYVWRLRVRVLSCLLEAGHSVILSDSDALWLKDPFLDFDLPEVRGSSIVASRGSFPQEVGSVWGSTLCMGFIFFRAGTGVDMVLSIMDRLVMEIGDDQKAINFALDELAINWDMSTDMRYIPSTDFGRGTIAGLGNGDLNVTLLPHNRYTRRCNKVPISSDTSVAHCHSSKKGASKIKWMEVENLWVIDDLKGAKSSKRTYGSRSGVRKVKNKKRGSL